MVGRDGAPLQRRRPGGVFLRLAVPPPAAPLSHINANTPPIHQPNPIRTQRKVAALEVEQTVKRLAAAGDHARVASLIGKLIAGHAFSPQPNHRKGALLCLAAATVGLGDAPGEEHLRQIVPPILASFTDQDSR